MEPGGRRTLEVSYSADQEALAVVRTRNGWQDPECIRLTTARTLVASFPRYEQGGAQGRYNTADHEDDMGALGRRCAVSS